MIRRVRSSSSHRMPGTKASSDSSPADWSNASAGRPVSSPGKRAASGPREGTGSLRSIPGVDLGSAIRGAVAEGLLLKGGGHAMAAGLTVTPVELCRTRRLSARPPSSSDNERGGCSRPRYRCGTRRLGCNRRADGSARTGQPLWAGQCRSPLRAAGASREVRQDRRRRARARRFSKAATGRGSMPSPSVPPASHSATH